MPVAHVRASGVVPALVSHPEVAEAAVVGAPDPATGQAIVAFVIPRRTATADDRQQLAAELRNHVADAIGPIATPRQILIVTELPRTRSGKIMRRLLRDVAENAESGDGYHPHRQLGHGPDQTAAAHHHCGGMIRSLTACAAVHARRAATPRPAVQR